MTETEKYQLTAMKNATLAEKNAPKSAPMTYNNKGQSVQPPVTPVQKQMYDARNESRRLDIHEKEVEAQRIKGLQAQYDEKMKTINKTDPHFGIESQDVSKSTVGAGAGAYFVYKEFGTKTVAVVGLLGVAAVGTYKLHENINKITGNNDTKVEKTEKIDENSVEVEETGKTVDDILEGGVETTRVKGKARNVEKTGGFDQALEDFDALNPSNTKDIPTKYGDGKFGILEDGTTISVRPGSETGGPTLEIKIPGQRIIKVRY